MIDRTAAADTQLIELIDHYLKLGRLEAAENLYQSYHAALRQIEADPTVGLTYPRPYTTLTHPGRRWIKIHRYWFSYIVIDGRPVLTAVLYETADLPSRVQGIDRVIQLESDDTPGG